MAVLTRNGLVAAILNFLSPGDFLTRDDVREELEREVDRAGAAALLDLKSRLEEDHGWTYYPADPLARRIHHLLADRFIRDDSRLDGLRHLELLGEGPVVMCANHLSYADGNVIYA